MTKIKIQIFIIEYTAVRYALFLYLNASPTAFSASFFEGISNFNILVTV